MTISPSMLTLIDTASEAVRQSLKTFVENEFKSNPEYLSQTSVSELTRGLQESFNEAGRDALKSYIEQFECLEKTIERDGKLYRLQNKCSPKKFAIVFGEMTVRRRYYHPRSGGKGIVPLDEKWGMVNRYATPEVVENVLWASSALVPSKVKEAYQRLGGSNISTSCIQDIISKDGAGIADMLEEEDEGVACREIEVPEGTETFVVSCDGANLLTRKQGKRSGRKPQRPSLHEAEVDEKGKSNTSYRNAMVGCFSFYETVDGVVDIGNGVEGLCPDRLSSIYNARMPQEDAVDFKREFEAIINEVTPKLGEDVAKIILADGARSIWKYARGNPLFKDYNLMLDYFHASEHLSLASEAIFGKGSEAARQWFRGWCKKLKYEEGAAEGVLRSMTRYHKTGKLTKSRKSDLSTQIVFFRNNKSLMNYFEHVAKGWPIGSGPVEAACKSIVKARFCQSGMRWSTKGGRNVLALRVLTNSNQWDVAWAKYRAEKWRSTG